MVDQTDTSTLHICNIYSFTVWSFRTLEQRLHTKMPRTNNCISNVNRRTDWGIAIALSQIGWLGAKKRVTRCAQNTVDMFLKNKGNAANLAYFSDLRFYLCNIIWLFKLINRRFCTGRTYNWHKKANTNFIIFLGFYYTEWKIITLLLIFIYRRNLAKPIYQWHV